MGKSWNFSLVGRYVIAFVSLGALFAPLSLGFFFSSNHLETNSGRRTPKPELSATYFKNLSAWLSESVAFKDVAVKIDAQIDESLFRERASAGSTSPRVVEGKGENLFITDAFNEACNPHIQTDQLVNKMKLLSRAIRNSGRDFRLVVSPDKSTILQDLLPVDFALKDCFMSYNADFWEKISSGGITGFINLRDELLKARIERRELLFKLSDTHWDQAGGAVAARTVVNSIRPNSWDDELLRFNGLIEETGDLNVLLGNKRTYKTPTYALTKTDVEQVESRPLDSADHGQNKRLRHSSSSSQLISGKTVIFGDSFSEAASPFYQTYFEDVSFMRLFDFSIDKFVSLIDQADRVIFWSVERSFAYRVAYEWGSDAFIDSLEQALK